VDTPDEVAPQPEMLRSVLAVREQIDVVGHRLGRYLWFPGSPLRGAPERAMQDIRC
jgi:hypothetical protein